MTLGVRRPRATLIVAAVFFVVAIAGGISVVGSVLPGGLVDPNAPSTAANYRIETDFDGARENMTLLVESESDLTGLGPATAGRELTVALAGLDGIKGAQSFWTTGDRRLLSEDSRSALVLLASERPVDEVLTELEPLEQRLGPQLGEPRFVLGGAAVLDREIRDQTTADLYRTELVALPLTLVVLLFVFRGLFAAGLPLAIGALSVAGAMLIMNVLAQFVPVSVYALNLVTALGLALGVDYSLLIVRRYREELDRSDDVNTSIAHAMRTAGRTVVVSGLCLIVALCSLLVFQQFFLRSFVYGGVSVVLLSVLAAMVVLPALLRLIGLRINRLNPMRRQVGTDRWARWGAFVVRRRFLAAGAALAVLLIVSLPALGLRLGLADHRDLPPSAQAGQLRSAIDQEFPTFRGSFLVVITGLPADAGAEVSRYATELSQLDGVTGVEYGGGLVVDGRQALPPDQYSEARFVRSGMTWLRLSSDLPDSSAESKALLERVRGVPGPGLIEIGGPTAALVDTTDAFLEVLPTAIGIVVIGSAIVLLLATGGVLVTAKAILLNLLTFGAVIGFIVWAIQQNHLNGVLGTFQQVDYTDMNALILVLVIAFGLSLDYEVFLLERVREYHRAGLSNNDAVIQGLARTGGTITSAALVMLVVLIGLTASETLSLKIIGAGLSFAIVLDAFIVRCTLVPALLSLAGAANWWSPRWLAALRVQLTRPGNRSRSTVSISQS